MINISVKCPHCGKSMMSAKKKMSGKSAIEVKITYAGKNAHLYLSSIYGSYDTELGLNIPLGKIAGFRCPHCRADLKSTRKCDICSAQMVAFDLKDGGQVQICSRRGCKKHILEFQDPKSELQAFYKSYLKAFK
ncbi:MAG: class I tRNA ligase family protein [Elusimicrobia bacterium]|nr:class I tRNA ligase family protein [Elusimicrobiota bacterium]